MDTLYTPQLVEWEDKTSLWGGFHVTQLHGRPCVLYFIWKRPLELVMPHWTQEFSCPRGFPMVFSILLFLPSLLQAWNCHSEPRRGRKSLTKITSVGVFSYLVMSSLEISLSGRSCKNSFDPPNVLSAILLKSTQNWSLNQSLQFS